MSRKRLVAAGAVVVVVALVAVVFVLVRGDGPDDLPGSGSDEGRALAQARLACAAMSDVETLVRANAKASEVFDAVDRASVAGKDAAANDLKWLPLSSGIEAVKVGLKDNDGQAANVGIRSVRAQCDPTTP